MERPNESPNLKINKLGGVDESNTPLNLQATKFDQLLGLYPYQNGALRRIPGKEIFAQLTGEPILSIHPTYDAQQHILVETTTKLRIYTLDELIGRNTLITSLSTNPTPPPIVEEDAMPRAIILHSQNSGVSNPQVVPLSTWTTLTLNDIQLNESTIINLSSNQITLNAAGTYRFRAWQMKHIDSTIPILQSKTQCRFLNTTTSANAFIGTSGNENLFTPLYTSFASGALAQTNQLLHFSGSLIVVAPTIILLQGIDGVNSGSVASWGKASAQGGREIYAMVEITKVA